MGTACSVSVMATTSIAGLTITWLLAGENWEKNLNGLRHSKGDHFTAGRWHPCGLVSRSLVLRRRFQHPSLHPDLTAAYFEGCHLMLALMLQLRATRWHQQRDGLDSMGR